MRRMIGKVLLLAFMLLVMIGLDVHVLIEAVGCVSGAAVAKTSFVAHICSCMIYSLSSARGDAGNIIRNGNTVIHTQDSLLDRTRP
jgi:hypothetical protein